MRAALEWAVADFTEEEVASTLEAAFKAETGSALAHKEEASPQAFRVTATTATGGGVAEEDMAVIGDGTITTSTITRT